MGKWARSDLNRGPSDYESPDLTPELRAQKTSSAPFAPAKESAASRPVGKTIHSHLFRLDALSGLGFALRSRLVVSAQAH